MPAGADDAGPRLRRLETRIAELEAQLVDERRAAAAARELVADEAHRRQLAEQELHDRRARDQAPPAETDLLRRVARRARRALAGRPR